MLAYVLLVLAVISRVIPHPDWLNFTAVGGTLLYFGARKPLRAAWLPLVLLMATDYYLTVYTYNYPFQVISYLPTWIWYLAALVLGRVVLGGKGSFLRVGVATLLGPTSFFLISNFAVWASTVMYPHTLSGLATCYAAGLPFYRNDIVSTALVLGLAFGLPALAHKPVEAESRRIA